MKQLPPLADIELELLVKVLNTATIQGNMAPVVVSLVQKISKAVELKKPEPTDKGSDNVTGE
jgi:hypothetical protein